MNYLSVERFLTNQERLTKTEGLMFQIGDMVSTGRSSYNQDWKVVEFAMCFGGGISCLLEKPADNQIHRGDEPWQGNGWQHGTNEQGQYVVRRVMKYKSLFLTHKAYDNHTEIEVK